MKTVAIVIPTFNEENNISNIISDILDQKIEDFKIEKIIILDDCSEDDTIRKALELKDNRLEIIRGKKRMGKARRMNEIFKTCKQDILIQYDADVRLLSKNATNNLVKIFAQKPEMDIVFGKQLPLKPITYIEKLACFGFYVWEDAKESLGRLANRYRVHGQIRAFSKKFFKEYQVFDNKAITEDTYSFYYAVQNNKNIYFQSESVAYFRLASTFQDYVKQMSRFIRIGNYIQETFDKKLFDKYEVITPKIKMKYLILRILKSPIHISIGYLLMHIYTRISVLFYKAKPVWDISKSTKLLSNKS